MSRRERLVTRRELRLAAEGRLDDSKAPSRGNPPRRRRGKVKTGIVPLGGGVCLIERYIPDDGSYTGRKGVFAHSTPHDMSLYRKLRDAGMSDDAALEGSRLGNDGRLPSSWEADMLEEFAMAGLCDTRKPVEDTAYADGLAMMTKLASQGIL